MKRLIAVALVAITFLSCKHGPYFLPRLKYTQGIKTDLEYHLYIVSDEDPSDAINNEVTRMGFSVDSVIHDSIFVFTAKVDYIRTRENDEFAMLNPSFDTESPPVGYSSEVAAYNHLVKPLVDSALILTVSSRGRIVKPFAFLHGRRLPGHDPLDYDLCQIIFPKDSVAMGDEWTTEKNNSVIGAKVIMHYYIKFVEDATLDIKVHGTAMQDGKEGKITGDYVIDRKDGSLISGKIEITGETVMHGKGKLVVDITSREWGTM